ncbi:hypothetical protein IJ732_08035 [bacterium]|nr:hypothetical protein [bacterium]
MALNLVELVSKSLVAPKSTTTAVRPYSENPFGGNNPFANVRPAENSSYMKNTPVKGGYFAGYHNGKPNIVGQRLFIEA